MLNCSDIVFSLVSHEANLVSLHLHFFFHLKRLYQIRKYLNALALFFVMFGFPPVKHKPVEDIFLVQEAMKKV